MPGWSCRYFLVILILASFLALPCAAESTISLKEGWNFISIPLNHVYYQYPVEALFSSVDAGGHSLFRYNASGQNWDILDLQSSISPTDGIWIYSVSPMNITVVGNNMEDPPQKHLYQGWNALGFSGYPNNPENAFSALTDKWLYAFGWNASNQQYEPAMFNEYQSDPPFLVPGKGYWIYMRVPAEYPNLMTPPPSDYDYFMNVDFLDVGQGDAILIRSPNNHNMLIDAGPAGAGQTVVDYASSFGVTHYDFIVATHPHEDHIGGMGYVINHTTVGQFIDSGYPSTSPVYYDLLTLLNQKNISYRSVKNGDFINLDPEVTIQVLNPQTTFFDNPNDNSIVLKMTYGNKSVLFTGDIDTTAENYLLSHGAQLRANVLKVAHHGSDSSSSMAFLTQVSPVSSVIEVGTGNDYGHPSPVVLQRLQQVGSEIYRTDLNRNIPIQIYRNGAMGIGPISINLTPTPITIPTTLPPTPNTTIPTTSPTTGIPGTGNIVVSDLNLSGEYVIIHNEGTSAVSLTGWNLHDEGSNYNYPFPAVLISPGSPITIYSHATGTDTATDLYWTLNNVWNNDGDTAYLVDSLGYTVSSLHSSG